MSRHLPACLAVVAALFFAASLRHVGVSPTMESPGAPRPAASPSAPEASLQHPRTAPPGRDVFRYLERTAASPPRAGVGATPAPTPALPTPEPGPTPPPLRLVGIVHRTGGLRAAVSTADGVVIVGPGDRVAGFTVLGVDEDRGLRLRAPDGTEVSLVPGGG